MDDSRKNPNDRKSLQNVRKRYGDLHDLLKSLSGKLTDVSSNVDREFLSSYRVHMLSVQSEIKTLKEDVLKGEQALNSDGTVAKLETEVKWFIDECNRLRANFVSMEADCKQMSGRYTALAEQKVYLNEQLKAIMKRNRVLQAEIDYATQGQMGDDNPYQLGEGGIALNRSSAIQYIQDEEEDAYIMDDSGNRRGKQSHGSKLFGERSSQFKSSSDIPSSLSIPHGRSGMNRGGNAQSSSALHTKGKVGGTTGMHRQTSAPQGLGYGKDCNTPTKTRRNNNPLSPSAADRQMATATGITAAAYDAHQMSHKQKLDAFLAAQCQAEFVLERAAMDIFNEIKERKHVAAKNASVKRFPAIVRKQGHAAPASALQTEVALSSDEIDIYAKTSIIQAAGGMSGLGFEQFSDNDRFSAIVKFLLNFNQFKEVVERMHENL